MSWHAWDTLSIQGFIVFDRHSGLNIAVMRSMDLVQSWTVLLNWKENKETQDSFQKYYRFWGFFGVINPMLVRFESKCQGNPESRVASWVQNILKVTIASFHLLKYTFNTLNHFKVIFLMKRDYMYLQIRWLHFCMIVWFQ